MPGKSPCPEAVAGGLRSRIEQCGPIGFDEFMAVALYDPHGGYYASRHRRTGKHGDFFTSVSVGPVYGRLLAAQFTGMWDALGRPSDFMIVEQGAADGQLMADVLDALERDAPSFVPRVIIIEPLELLRAMQNRTLAPWADRVTHVHDEKDLPAFTGVFFANELVDAFPVKLLVREGGAWRERRVSYDGEKFVFVEATLEDPALLAAAQALPVPRDIPRFATEICPSLEGWMRAVAGKLARGWILLVDYGHPAAVRHHAARAGGTLAAYRGHRRQDNPLDSPGEQDLTAHVDFTALARAGEAAGLSLAGYTDQHHALASLAARVFPAMAAEPLDPGAAKEMRALRQLLHPESMGKSFKFLALVRGACANLAAFRFARDPRAELFA